jgi:CheY-like chemotaxis protein
MAPRPSLPSEYSRALFGFRNSGGFRHCTLEAVLAHKPDVFLTEIEVPHMTGLDVAAELKRRRTGTRVVM